MADSSGSVLSPALNATNTATEEATDAVGAATDPNTISNFVDNKPMDPDSASEPLQQSSEEQINALMSLVKDINGLVNAAVTAVPKAVIGTAVDGVKEGVGAAKDIIMKPVQEVGSALSGALGQHDQGAQAANQQSAPAPQPAPEDQSGLGLT